MAGGFTCSLVALDVIGQALALNVRQYPIDFPVHGDTEEDRIRLAHQAERDLASQNLIRTGSLAPVVPELVGLFAAGRSSVAILGEAGRHFYCARASSDGRRAVLAAQHGEEIDFDPIRPETLVRSVVGMLPRLRPGPGRSVTIAPDDPPSTGQPGRDDFSADSFLQRATPARTGGSQRALMDAILSRPRTGSGRFVVTGRGRNHRESQAGTLIWIDTDAGRYMLVRDSRGYVTCAPADLPRIDQHLARYLSTLE